MEKAENSNICLRFEILERSEFPIRIYRIEGLTGRKHSDCTVVRGTVGIFRIMGPNWGPLWDSLYHHSNIVLRGGPLIEPPVCRETLVLRVEEDILSSLEEGHCNFQDYYHIYWWIDYYHINWRMAYYIYILMNRLYIYIYIYIAIPYWVALSVSLSVCPPVRPL